MSPKNLNVSNKTHKNLLNKLRDKRIFQIYKKFEKDRLRISISWMSEKNPVDVKIGTHYF